MASTGNTMTTVYSFVAQWHKKESLDHLRLLSFYKEEENNEN